MSVPYACKVCGGRNLKPTGEIRHVSGQFRLRVEIACLDCQHAWFSVAASLQDDAQRKWREQQLGP